MCPRCGFRGLERATAISALGYLCHASFTEKDLTKKKKKDFRCGRCAACLNLKTPLEACDAFAIRPGRARARLRGQGLARVALSGGLRLLSGSFFLPQVAQTETSLRERSGAREKRQERSWGVGRLPHEQ